MSDASRTNVTDPIFTAGPILDTGTDTGPMVTQYLIDTQFWFETGNHVYPVAANYPSAGRVISEHGGKWWKVVGWTVERTGAPPVMPHWNTNNANDVLVRIMIQPANSLAGVGGKPAYRRSGKYFYEQILPPGDGNGGGLVCGFCPYDPGGGQQVVINGSEYNTSLLRG